MAGAAAAGALGRPGRRPGTSRDQIVRIAIELLDRGGPDSLTFRGVARELDMTVGALSRYFDSIADLRDAVAAQIISGLRPLDAKGKRAVRADLVRLGMDWLEINRAHPYLPTIHGAASAEVIVEHISLALKSLVACGVEFGRAVTIYSLVTNVAHAWGVEQARQGDPAMQATVVQAFSNKAPELAAQLNKLAAAHPGGIYRRSFEMLVEGMLP